MLQNTHIIPQYLILNHYHHLDHKYSLLHLHRSRNYLQTYLDLYMLQVVLHILMIHHSIHLHSLCFHLDNYLHLDILMYLNLMLMLYHMLLDSYLLYYPTHLHKTYQKPQNYHYINHHHYQYPGD